MKKILIYSSCVLLSNTVSAMCPRNQRPAFKAGEWLKFRIHYGFLNASYATLQLSTTIK